MENVVFSQSIIGFNRGQVLSYIDTIVKQLKEQENEYTQTQERLQQEVDSLSAKCLENKEDLTLTVEKIKELSEEIEYFKKNNYELKNQTDHYRNLILSKDSEIISLKKDTGSLKVHCEQLSQENEKWKSKQNQIAECLVEAGLRADEIIQAAQRDADAQKIELHTNAAAMSGSVVGIKDEIAQVEKQLEQSFQKLQKAMSDMDASAQTIEDQVNAYKEKVDGIDIPSEAQPIKKHIPQGIPQARQYLRPVKRNLTDTVLDTISKILDK